MVFLFWRPGQLRLCPLLAWPAPNAISLLADTVPFVRPTIYSYTDGMQHNSRGYHLPCSALLVDFDAAAGQSHLKTVLVGGPSRAPSGPGFPSIRSLLWCALLQLLNFPPSLPRIQAGSHVSSEDLFNMNGHLRNSSVIRNWLRQYPYVPWWRRDEIRPGSQTHNLGPHQSRYWRWKNIFIKIWNSN